MAVESSYLLTSEASLCLVCVLPPSVRFAFLHLHFHNIKIPLPLFLLLFVLFVVKKYFRCICLCDLIRNSGQTTSSAVVFHKLLHYSYTLVLIRTPQLSKLPCFVFGCFFSFVFFNQSLFFAVVG